MPSLFYSKVSHWGSVRGKRLSGQEREESERETEIAGQVGQGGRGPGVTVSYRWIIDLVPRSLPLQSKVGKE